ncbi:arginine utilization regulatory protein RocR [Anaerotignum neopropionicum]|uniref:Arginine utilization regulatory protein RocR n=1 Tax=Anaerotignum neopropionicum TaxID=36847 RepID=A0A136WIQ1_9FIRM|nr:sigma-54-dependent Fis family transcriptional regulator [Anaerotignum neopropionicum]KXL54229.1 arginine utilization regulatory protein RocR [Anaerotignum neopropionicum]KXL54354.1 arginine utilization regulatory protein RocR [Anaerotignum neopropionicum]
MTKRAKNAEISFIAPSEKLAIRAKKIIKERNEDIDVYISALNEAYILAKELRKNGTRVIISRKGTKAFMEKHLDIPVVGVNTILSDYIDILKTAKSLDGVIAFFTYDEITEGIKTMCYLLNINAKYYTFHDVESCEAIVKQAIDDGAKLGIGGALTETFSLKYNLEHIVVENSEEAIINSIETAKQILAIQKEELKKQEKLKLKLKSYQAVLDFTHDAIISVDTSGKLTVVNPVAERIMNVNRKNCIGKWVEDVLPNSKMIEVLHNGEKEINELMKINGTLVSTNRIPIIIDDKVKGAVATFQDIKTIQDSEKNIRMRLNKKGLTAKYTFDDIQGHSEAIQKTIDTAKRYALSNSTILIHGETGCGKELFAQSIHNYCARKNEPFVAINCAALSKNLLEAELFGYEDGSFTGALKGGKAGLFELAHKGTIFLDEIGEIPMDVQVQLLRVLQEKEIRRIGSVAVTPIDVRIITATNKRLEDEILNHRFREDLYYRLNVLNLEIPSLRMRREDVPEIGNSILKKLSGENYDEFKNYFDEVIGNVTDYDWPGNIRELHNFVERIFAILSGGTKNILLEDLINTSYAKEKKDLKFERQEQEEDLAVWERKKIIAALTSNNCSMKNAAIALGISRTTLWRKMKEYNIKP